MHAAPNRHAFIFATPSPAGPLSPISKNLCPVLFAPLYSPHPLALRGRDERSAGGVGDHGSRPVVGQSGSRGRSTVLLPSTRRMPESTPTRRRDEGPISCRLPAWTLVPPRPLLLSKTGRPDDLACPNALQTSGHKDIFISRTEAHLADAATLVGALRAAGETTRLRLLALLAEGEHSVKDLTEILGQSQPRVSRHLKLLADAGLVTRNAEGAWAYYRL